METTEQQIVELYKQGRSLRDIVSDLHIDHYTAWQALVKEGLDQKCTTEKRPKNKYRSYKKYSPEVWAKAVELKKQGVPGWKICCELNVSSSHLYRYLRKIGLASRVTKCTDELMRKISNLKDKGYTYLEMSKELNIPPSTICRYIAMCADYKQSEDTDSKLEEPISNPPEEHPVNSLEDEFAMLSAELEEAKKRLELVRKIKLVKDAIDECNKEISELRNSNS